MSKKKALIVGSFPDKEEYFLGGIHKTCHLLKNSKFFKRFNVATVDSTNVNSLNRVFASKIYFGILKLTEFVIKCVTFKPDVVIIFSSNNWGLLEKSIMGLAGKKLGASIIFCPRASEQLVKNNSIKRIVKFTLRSVDYFVCQGEKVSDALELDYCIEKRKIRIIRNWTATSDLLKLGSEKENNLLYDEPVELAFVGWLEKEKGVSELLEAVSELKKQNLNFKLWVVGDGSMKKELEGFCNENSLNNTVNFTSWLPEKKLNDIYKKCHIFVLPSWSEGMPNAMIEAMASACVPVVTRVGNISDFINGENGIIFDPKDQKSLNKILYELICKKEKLPTISQNSYQTAKENFSTEANIEKFTKIVEQSIQ